ncbi:MAG: hypothetical protein ACM3PY_12765 [Omnitrophica WOR_2 bacterium]
MKKNQKEQLSNRVPSTSENILYQVSENLIQKGARPAANALLKLLRFQRRDQAANLRETPKVNPKTPTGPFISSYGPNDVALINFVPRDIQSRLIDNATGKYGYSHTTVDVGQIDIPTGKRTMIGSTPFHVVHRDFLDAYGDRKFARIPLAPAGVDVKKFSDCVISKLGEKYGYMEALTWGEVDDPARQMCSDLAANCLPEEIREDIARKYQEGKLPKHSVSVHPGQDGRIGLFASPNALSYYFGAPRGEDLVQRDQVAMPKRTLAGDQVKQIAGSSKGFLPLGILLSSALIGFGCFLFISWIARRASQAKRTTPEAGNVSWQADEAILNEKNRSQDDTITEASFQAKPIQTE